MTQKIGVKPAQVKIYALVRDAYGKPKIDGNPDDLHQSILEAMTPQEIIEAKKEFLKWR